MADAALRLEQGSRRDDRAQQLVGVKAAFDKDGHLAGNRQFHRTRRGCMAMGRLFDCYPVEVEVDRGRGRRGPDLRLWPDKERFEQSFFADFDGGKDCLR